MLNPSGRMVSEGDDVLVYIDRRRRWIIKVTKGKIFGSDRGTARHDDMIGVEFGGWVQLSTGFKAYLLRPLLIDYLEKAFVRKTQVIYPKDMGLIIVLTGIGPGSRVLEAGIGSGFMTAVLANIVRPNGKIYAYEVREDFAQTAIRNLQRIGLDKFVEVKIRDIRQGVDEKELDAAILDMPNPWEALDVIYEALRPSAPVIFFLPTINQVEKLLKALKGHGGFTDFHCYETLLREYRLAEDAIRPETRMIGHTGYVFFARKVLKS